eukprot:756411-Hanusia_phi.AAC.1
MGYTAPYPTVDWCKKVGSVQVDESTVWWGRWAIEEVTEGKVVRQDWSEGGWGSQVVHGNS